MQAIIDIQQLKFAWTPDHPTLDIPSFTMSSGERCFLYGPSGCGKSTLLGVVAGVNRPNSGSVNVLGDALYSKSQGARDHFRAHHIGFIFQMFNLLPYLSILENVLLPCRFSKLRRDRAIAKSGSIHDEATRLLADLGLGSKTLLGRKVVELSIGQQQRVAAARALVGSPEVIIADEPTSALDTDSREAFIETLFKECDEQGSSLLFVSHDLTLRSLFTRQASLPELNQVRQEGELE